MGPDDEICYCFHVTKRKLAAFVERERPAKASQLTECLGAGTGCGWCIPFLKAIHERVLSQGDAGDLGTTPERYAAARSAYRTSGGEKNRF